jgi:hypothetical protein
MTDGFISRHAFLLPYFTYAFLMNFLFVQMPFGVAKVHPFYAAPARSDIKGTFSF